MYVSQIEAAQDYIFRLQAKSLIKNKKKLNK